MTNPINRVRVEDNITALHWKRRKTSYLVRVRGYSERVFAKLSDARRYKRECIATRVGVGFEPKFQARSRKSFTSAYKAWLSECRGEVSKGWMKDLERYGAKFFTPSFHEMAIDGIRPRDIGNLLEDLRSLGYSAQSRLHVYNALHKFFDDCIEHFEWLDASPVRKRYRPKVRRVIRKFLTPDEAASLLRAATGSVVEPALYLGLFAGLRPSESQALRWESVDLVANVITIKEAFKRKIGVVEPFPKQKDWGRAMIPKPLADFLLSQSRVSEFVSPSPNGGMLSYNTMLRSLRTLCCKAGVTVVTPHELRHSCTELWVSNGATREDCTRELNHSSSRVTDRYMHRTDDRLTRIANSFVLPESGPKEGSKLVLVTRSQG